MTDQDLSPQQQAMVEIWEKHMAAEFKTKNIDATMATMTSDPSVNHVPVMTGGVGYDEVRHFYSTYLFPVSPPTPRSCRSLVRLAVVVVVQFKDGKIAGEHIYWGPSLSASAGRID